MSSQVDGTGVYKNLKYTSAGQTLDSAVLEVCKKQFFSEQLVVVIFMDDCIKRKSKTFGRK